ALEDSENGWKSAHAAGLKCVVTVNDYTRVHDFDGADLVVSELGEPDGDGVELLANPHMLDVHHVELRHLKAIMA
ncbi:MAG: HAD family hydrolase, partial [Mariprofundus sp.]